VLYFGRCWNRLAVHKMRFYRFLNLSGQFFPGVSGAVASFEVGKANAVSMGGIAKMNVYGVKHRLSVVIVGFHGVIHSPACFIILFAVGKGKSFFGCGTVTLPVLLACLNWWCEPLTCTKNQPSCCMSLIKSLLFMNHTVKIIHNNTHNLDSSLPPAIFQPHRPIKHQLASSAVDTVSHKIPQALKLKRLASGSAGEAGFYVGLHGGQAIGI
jgi:hypothetical protein